MHHRQWFPVATAWRRRPSLLVFVATLFFAVVALISTPAAAAPGDSLAQAAQKGVDFLVPDVVDWTNWNGCIACHRQGAALYGMAVAKNAGFTTNLSTGNGAGYVAEQIAQNQGPDGSWDWGSGLKSSYTLLGLAGYDAYVSTAYANNVVAGADWAVSVQDPDGHWWLDFEDGVTAHGDVTITGRFMVGIAQAKQRVDATKAAAYQASLDRAAGYLAAHKSDPSDYSGVGTVYELAWAIVGAKAAGLADSDPTIVSLVASLQASKSYLGYAWGEQPGWGPDLYNSGLAVYALCQAGVSAIGNTPLLNALDWVNQQQAWDGSWGNDISTTFAILGLACYGEYGVIVSNVGPVSKIISSHSASPQTVTYTFDVQNHGFQNDSYTLAVVGGMIGWTASVQGTVSIAAGAHQQVTVTVNAPANLPEALPVQMALVATSAAVSTVSTQARFTTYTDPPPPTSGDSTAVALVGGNGGSVQLAQSVTLQATVTDTTSGVQVHGPGKGVVTFFVAGLAVGVDSDSDGNGVYSFTFTPDCAWNALGSQDFRAIYSGIDLPAGQTDMLSSLAAGAITITAPACCPKPETCNGKDDDCDGVIDNGFNVGTACSAGVGQCAAAGTIQCTSPSASACNAVAGAPHAETCDGKDNDCDGVVDNGSPGAGVACVTGLHGVCSAGTTACTGGAVACVPSVTPGSHVEICDGLDNDCDGVVDNGFNVGTACSAGVGECLRTGTVQCTAQGTAACNAVAGAPQPETCDGKDNDCDGVVDNGFNVGTACSAGLGECLHGGTVQCTAQGTAACNAVAGAPHPETCDGKDNDCDGVIDNGNPGGALACATGLHGVCSAGTTACSGGSIACVPGVLPGAHAEICDGLDNDCDGVVDQGFNVGTACSAGIGECLHGGTVQCTAQGTSACNAVAGAPQPETCDGKDNDCDGVIDNGNPGGGVACATGLLGVCSAGSTACQSGAIACVAHVTPGSQTEICDGLDNDCDGRVDQGFNVGTACSAGVGECLHGGTVQCTAQGTSACNAVAGAPQPETCDGKDNDCDGVVDNGFNLGAACTSGLGECLRSGTRQCTAQGTAACGAVAGAPQPETCDGKDNDCDGVVDNGFHVGAACTSGVGECLRSGNLQCTAQGGEACSAVAGAPHPETCDGKDNDCDGVVDNGNPGGGVACATGLHGVCSPGTTACATGAIACVPHVTPGSQTEICDGLDNDCDGLVDEGFHVGDACTGGVGACLRLGSFACLGDGTAACNAVPGAPQPEICGDAVDSDCDGLQNNGCACLGDEGCGGATSGVVCDTGATGTYTCVAGCRGQDGNGCPAGTVCTSPGGVPGACVQCLADAHCGGAASGAICDPSTHACVSGCRGQGGNGCPSGRVCSSPDGVAGACVECVADADCGGQASGKVCDPATDTCQGGCRGQGGNGCPSGQVCSSSDSAAGTCVACVVDADCGGQASGKVCDPAASACVAGCRGQSGNGCAGSLRCTSTDGAAGACVDCVADADCGGAAGGQICDLTAHLCKQGCRGQDGNGCAGSLHCTSQDAAVGTCVACLADADCGGATSGAICDPTSHACAVGCRAQSGNGCPTGRVCTSPDAAPGACVGCVTDADCGDAASGKVCDPSTLECAFGCRGAGGNGCALGSVCNATGWAAGKCVGCVSDADCGDAASGEICDPATSACQGGCRGAGGNGCPAGTVCSSADGSAGSCVQCVADADCGGATSGQACVNHACLSGCHGAGGNGCPAGTVCSSADGSAGSCVQCVADADCGGATSGQVCAGQTCQTGCRGSGGNGCPSGLVCSSTGGGAGSCVGCAGDADCGGGASGQVCVSETCQAGCRGSGNGCPSGSTCSSADGEVGTCAVSSVTVTVIATGPDALPNGATPGGTGVLCAARPGPAGDDATWLLGLAIGALALGARRRRAA
jgi:hypothetical protein